MTYSEQLDTLFKDALRYKRDIERCERELLKLQNELYGVSFFDVCIQIASDIHNAASFCEDSCNARFLYYMSLQGWVVHVLDSYKLTKVIFFRQCTIYYCDRGISSVEIDGNFKYFSHWLVDHFSTFDCQILRYIRDSVSK